MLTRERFIEEVKDAGLDWQRGFVVSDDSNRYEDLCRVIEALVRAECVPDELLFTARLKIAEDASVPMDADFNRVVQSVIDHLREAAPGITAPQEAQQ